MKTNTCSKLLTFFLLLAVPFVSYAQDAGKQSSDFMRSNGRSYVVIAVMLTILIGLFLYLVRLDRKLTKLEKENHL
jgi:CcmD family protein